MAGGLTHTAHLTACTCRFSPPEKKKGPQAGRVSPNPQSPGSVPTPPSDTPRAAHQVGPGAQAHLAHVDGEDGVGAGALHVHLGAGRGARQGALLQALDQLRRADVRTSWLQSPAPAPSPRAAPQMLTSSWELMRREVTPVV